jgi:hypothetical protein
MFLEAQGLSVSISTDRTCTLTALPSVPSAVTLSTDRAFVLSVPTHVTPYPAIATKQLWHAECCWYAGRYLQFLSEWNSSRYYIERRKCCGWNHSILVALYSVIAGCKSFRANILFTRSVNTVLSYWPRLPTGSWRGDGEVSSQADMHGAHSTNISLSFSKMLTVNQAMNVLTTE